MTLVQYLATQRIHIPAGTIAAYVRDGLVDVVFNESEISPKLIVAFSALSNAITCTLPVRNAPSEPWCPIVIERRDNLENLEKIVPEISPGGIVLPVPGTLISARMALHVTLISTDVTRWVERPPWLDGGEPPPSLITRGV